MADGLTFSAIFMDSGLRRHDDRGGEAPSFDSRFHYSRNYADARTSFAPVGGCCFAVTSYRDAAGRDGAMASPFR